MNAWLLVALRALALAAVLPLSACGLSTAQRIATALNATATAVDAASATTLAGCKAAGEIVIARAAAGQLDADAAEAKLDAALERCDRMRDGYGAIRAIHAQAVAALEGGDAAGAQALLDQLAALWAGLKEP